MTPDPASWLNQISADAGVLGCGLRFPSSQCVTQSFSPQFPSARLDEVWCHFSEMIKALQLRRLPLQRLFWKFHLYHLWYVVRPDGLALGLVLRPDSPENRVGIELLVREFLRQDWTRVA